MPVAQSATLKKRWYPKDNSKYFNSKQQQQNKPQCVAHGVFWQAVCQKMKKLYLKICQPILGQYKFQFQIPTNYHWNLESLESEITNHFPPSTIW